MVQPIILYDILANVPGKTISGNVFKTRYTLAYKDIPFETVYIEIQDIEVRMKAIGAKPTAKKSDGSDFYTLPTIQDPNTGAIVSDSFIIAEYLDKTYPSTPRVFPSGTNALINIFDGAFHALAPIFLTVIVKLPPNFHPKHAEYFKRRAEERLGVTFEEISPQGPKREQDWKNLKTALDAVNGWYARCGGKWIMGGTFSYADIVVVAWLRSLKIVLEEGEWKEMSEWNGGRWGKLIEEEVDRRDKGL